MRDRGTLIAGAGIALAFLIAGVAYLFFARQDAAEQHAIEEAVAEQHHVRAMQQLQINRQAALVVVRTPEDAIAAGANWLVEQQSPDGAWRSDTYATFKSGTALTPQVVVALQAVNKPEYRPKIAAGCDWLAGLVKPDGSIAITEGDLDFPVYTAALSVVALSHADQKHHVKARDAWLRFLLSHQLTEKLGWKPEDKQYGGWGYCRFAPKKPGPGAISPPLVESNLSATVFALDALKAAGVTDKDVYLKALAFVRRCQNHLPIDSPIMLPPEYSDGGFSFIYDDPVRNKAGEIQPRASSRDSFNSYGSATADGLRALRLCSETDTARTEQAVRWLKERFRADKHPGKYLPSIEPNREAVYFYYAASVSKVLRTEKLGGAADLTRELLRRQQADGSWANELNLVREDDPIVATSHALISLSNCAKK